MIGIAVGCVSMFIAVLAGAFGTHSLEAKLPENMLNAWRVAAQYQVYHSLALILAGLYCQSFHRKMRSVKILFTLGIVLFCGSLYVMALSGIRALGMITPVGGLAFMLGWLNFAWIAAKRPLKS